MSTVTVFCSHHTGILLTVDGVSVEVKGIRSNVDEGFWNKWLAAHRSSPLVLSGTVSAHPETPAVAEDPPEAQEKAPGNSKPKGQPKGAARAKAAPGKKDGAEAPLPPPAPSSEETA